MWLRVFLFTAYADRVACLMTPKRDYIGDFLNLMIESIIAAMLILLWSTIIFGLLAWISPRYFLNWKSRSDFRSLWGPLLIIGIPVGGFILGASPFLIMAADQPISSSLGVAIAVGGVLGIAGIFKHWLTWSRWLQVYCLTNPGEIMVWKEWDATYFGFESLDDFDAWVANSVGLLTWAPVNPDWAKRRVWAEAMAKTPEFQRGFAKIKAVREHMAVIHKGALEGVIDRKVAVHSRQFYFLSGRGRTPEAVQPVVSQNS